MHFIPKTEQRQTERISERQEDRQRPDRNLYFRCELTRKACRPHQGGLSTFCFYSTVNGKFKVAIHLKNHKPTVLKNVALITWVGDWVCPTISIFFCIHLSFSMAYWPTEKMVLYFKTSWLTIENNVAFVGVVAHACSLGCSGVEAGGLGAQPGEVLSKPQSYTRAWCLCALNTLSSRPSFWACPAWVLRRAAGIFLIHRGHMVKSDTGPGLPAAVFALPTSGPPLSYPDSSWHRRLLTRHLS